LQGKELRHPHRKTFIPARVNAYIKARYRAHRDAQKIAQEAAMEVDNGDDDPRVNRTMGITLRKDLGEWWDSLLCQEGASEFVMAPEGCKLSASWRLYLSVASLISCPE